MPKRYTVEFTKGELDNIRWAANMGMKDNDSPTPNQRQAIVRGLTKMVEVTGREAVLSGGSVLARKKS